MKGSHVMVIEQVCNVLEEIISLVWKFERGIRAFEQQTRDLDVEIKQMKELKASYGVTTPQELHLLNFVDFSRNMIDEVDIDTLTIKQYLMLNQGNQVPGMVKTEFRGMMEKDIENMTIAEYMEYEVDMKSRVLGYTHHSDNSMINAYYDLPSLLPCFKPVQPHTKDMYEPFEEDTDYISETSE
ncbi:hypothetical protein Tco_1220292 [Tanacetum coccineum]